MDANHEARNDARNEMRESSERTIMNHRLSGMLFSLALVMAGCRAAGESGGTVAEQLESQSVAAANAANRAWKPVTFLDDAKLRDGTGPMDASPTDAGQRPEFLTTRSGLQYRILRASEGRKPHAFSTVTVNYRGWLGTGKVFDSSYERGQPTTFPLQNVVAGWTEGMQLVGEGGMIELWVPSQLGYGERGSPGSIPAHSDIHFIVEILDVK